MTITQAQYQRTVRMFAEIAGEPETQVDLEWGEYDEYVALVRTELGMYRIAERYKDNLLSKGLSKNLGNRWYVILRKGLQDDKPFSASAMKHALEGAGFTVTQTAATNAGETRYELRVGDQAIIGVNFDLHCPWAYRFDISLVGGYVTTDAESALLFRAVSREIDSILELHTRRKPTRVAGIVQQIIAADGDPQRLLG